MNNLPLLKDVHIPVDTWLFPLGYGWLLIILLLIFAYAFYKSFKFIRSKSKKYYALVLLKKADKDELSSAIKISEILRRVCLYKYKEAISLFGNDWVKFLNCKSKMTFFQKYLWKIVENCPNCPKLVL